jgi:sugar O-acyltransferase (sialic acid O-acetyltransferase NeuD family)
MSRTTDVRGVVIVGAGGFGREVYRYAHDCREAGVLEADVVGFADDRPDALKGFDVGPMLGRPGDLAWDRLGAVIAVGDPTARDVLAGLVRTSGGVLASLVHPTAYVAGGAVLGSGVVLCPFAFVSTDVTLGEGTVLNTYASVGHDCQVGASVVLSPYAVLNGNCWVGDRVFLGTHATVTPGRRIGHGSKISAGGVVFRDVPDHALAVGNPAKARVMFGE